ncbi:MAG: AMP-binding protein [Treponema sp.]|nr:AMP-binding protein [Treponema sp.]
MIILEKRTLGCLALTAAKAYKTKTAFQIYRDSHIYGVLNYAGFGEKALRFAGLLLDRGLTSGGRVMILSENHTMWPVAYFGTALAGGISVPALMDFTPGQISAIAAHCGASFICYSERSRTRFLEAEIDNSIPRLALNGKDLLEGKRMPEISSLPRVDENDPASIIYTSGTSGASKGVVLTHLNLIFTAQASRSLMKIYSRDRLLSVIPLAHTYECTLGLLAPVMSGASVTYLDKPASPGVLLPAMQTLRPTAMVSVPLFIEKICKNSIFPKLKKNPLYKFPLTRYLAIRAAGARLMAALGSLVRFFGLGGAPLDEEVENFLRKAGFPYAPGYGLTECAPLVTGTSPYHFPYRSSGRAVKGVSLRLAESGEIEVKGPNVMPGYYRDEERTKAAFTEDGWFKTGDLGRIDKKGCLYIKGRLKALILGPSGENIYPEEIEQLLYNSNMVEDALVVPGSRGELVALIVLDEKAQLALTALGEKLDELKNNINRRMAAFSRLSRIEVRQAPFEKTPTSKIKRFLYAPHN